MTREAYEVPLSPEPQRFNLTMAGADYICYAQWNVPAACWVLSISDADEAAILHGIPLVTGIDLLAQYKHLGFGGSLLVQTDYDADAVPTFANLGVTGRLYFIPD